MNSNEYIWPIIETSKWKTTEGKTLVSEGIVNRVASSEKDALRMARKSWRILKSPFDDTKRTYKAANYNSL